MFLHKFVHTQAFVLYFIRWHTQVCKLHFAKWHTQVWNVTVCKVAYTIWVLLFVNSINKFVCCSLQTGIQSFYATAWKLLHTNYNVHYVYLNFVVCKTAVSKGLFYFFFQWNYWISHSFFFYLCTAL